MGRKGSSGYHGFAMDLLRHAFAVALLSLCAGAVAAAAGRPFVCCADASSEGIDRVDDHTVRFRLRSPNGSVDYAGVYRQ